MGLALSPSIATDGLIFCSDMGNSKSFKGRPVTNQFTLPTSDTNGFGVQNSTFTRVRVGTYGGYTIKDSDYVWRYDITGNDCPYHGWDIPTTAGTIVTFSFDFYISPTTTGYPSNNLLAVFENLGSGTSGQIGDPSSSTIGVWKRVYFSATASATGGSRCLLYPGGCGAKLANSGYILYKNPQVEFNAPGGVPSPFVAGTRSNTQTITDLTNRNAVTASSLTYNSDGTYAFNGTSDYVDLGINSYGLGLTRFATYSSWIKPTTNVAMYGISDYGTNGLGMTLRTNSNVSADFYVYPNNHRITYTYAFNANVWYNLVGVMNGANMYMYLNGVQVGTTTLGEDIGNSSNTLKIGSRGEGGTAGAAYGTGYASHIMLYNRALSASEINKNFNALRGRHGV
jgi:hypothetical protein